MRGRNRGQELENSIRRLAAKEEEPVGRLGKKRKPVKGERSLKRGLECRLGFEREKEKKRQRGGFEKEIWCGGWWQESYRLSEENEET